MRLSVEIWEVGPTTAYGQIQGSPQSTSELHRHYELGYSYVTPTGRKKILRKYSKPSLIRIGIWGLLFTVEYVLKKTRGVYEHR